ncbi:hypothetical protein BCR33DRAFT_739436 [Rhizoclosmatium globosum]|uniref:Uncharacterized protein n=1 Tax=Rhizoclosmatium globosum TaxID=329046 RepID=A0A1Y2C4F0_9FUNG|nr:hypothetical protein BCR33DRAFT_739436 [Rhizoclosmatium globosum]|eukprot:ORY41908.1 hypothetical protein BCR33DRAFT_739436 [Rhizoclosmatium globosum]
MHPSLRFHRLSESQSASGAVAVYERDSVNPLYVLTLSPAITLFNAFNLATRVYVGSSPGCVLVPQLGNGGKNLRSAIKLPALETNRKNQHFEFTIDTNPAIELITHEFDIKNPMRQTQVKAAWRLNGISLRWREVGGTLNEGQFVLEAFLANGPDAASVAASDTSRLYTSARNQGPSKAGWEEVATATASRPNFYFNEPGTEGSIETPEFASITYTGSIWNEVQEADQQVFVLTFFQMLLGDLLNRDGRLEKVMLGRNTNARHEYVSPLARFNMEAPLWQLMQGKKQTMTVNKDALPSKKSLF